MVMDYRQFSILLSICDGYFGGEQFLHGRYCDRRLCFYPVKRTSDYRELRDVFVGDIGIS